MGMSGAFQDLYQNGNRPVLRERPILIEGIIATPIGEMARQTSWDVAIYETRRCLEQIAKGTRPVGRMSTLCRSGGFLHVVLSYGDRRQHCACERQQCGSPDELLKEARCCVGDAHDFAQIVRIADGA